MIGLYYINKLGTLCTVVSADYLNNKSILSWYPKIIEIESGDYFVHWVGSCASFVLKVKNLHEITLKLSKFLED